MIQFFFIFNGELIGYVVLCLWILIYNLDLMLCHVLPFDAVAFGKNFCAVHASIIGYVVLCLWILIYNLDLMLCHVLPFGAVAFEKNFCAVHASMHISLSFDLPSQVPNHGNIMDEWLYMVLP